MCKQIFSHTYHIYVCFRSHHHSHPPLSSHHLINSFTSTPNSSYQPGWRTRQRESCAWKLGSPMLRTYSFRFLCVIPFPHLPTTYSHWPPPYPSSASSGLLCVLGGPENSTNQNNQINWASELYIQTHTHMFVCLHIITVAQHPFTAPPPFWSRAGSRRQRRLFAFVWTWNGNFYSAIARRPNLALGGFNK